MKLFGITGGIGMGKSTAGAFLEQCGVAVIDTDVIARQLVEPGRPAFLEIASSFGSSVLSPGGGLNRRELGRLAFGEASAKARLEAILHPKIREVWQAQVNAWRDSGVKMGAVVIPLLYETRAEECFDAVVCVACSSETQWTRLRQRGWSEMEIQQRIDAQRPVKQKMEQAHHVIWTDTTLEIHAAQIAAICQS